MPLCAMEKPNPVQPPIYNAPSLKFLAAQSLVRSKNKSDIMGLSLPAELKKYALFMKNNDELFKKEFDAKDAQTLLETACLNGMLDESLLTDLRALNSQIDINGTKIKTLMAAAYGGYLSLADFLLMHGADIDHEIDQGHTAVRFCCYQPNKGTNKILALLCHRGAKVDLIDNDGKTALLALASSSNPESAQAADLLLQHGARIDYQEPRYLGNGVKFACYHKDTTLLKTLLKHNPNLELTDNLGRTAFIIAAQEKNITAMQLLKNAGARINIVPAGNQFFYPPLIYAAMHGDTQVAFNLLEWGTNVDTMDNSQETALMHATRNKNKEFVRLLLEYNANIHTRDIFGKTPIMIALEDGNFDLAQILLDQIAHFRQEPGDHGNLYLAFEKLVKTDRTEMLKQMLAKGAYTSLQKCTSLNIQLLKQATPAMRELLKNYRSPEYYQLSWHQRMLVDALQTLDNNGDLVGLGIGGAAVTGLAWYLLKK